MNWVASFSQHRNRSALVRIAIRKFAERERKGKSKAQEYEVLHKHQKLLAHQAQALLAEQARS